jgi:hypothetical protein
MSNLLQMLDFLWLNTGMNSFRCQAPQSDPLRTASAPQPSQFVSPSIVLGAA